MTTNEKENLYLVIFSLFAILAYDWMFYLAIVICWTVYEIAHFFTDYLVSIGRQYLAQLKYEQDYRKRMLEDEAQNH